MYGRFDGFHVNHGALFIGLVSVTPELRVSRIRGVKIQMCFFVGSRFITSTFGLRVFLSKNLVCTLW